MSYTTSCDGACPLENGNIITLVVQQQNDDDFSRLYLVSEMNVPGAAPQQTELLAINEWLTALHCTRQGQIVAVSDAGDAHHFDGSDWTIRKVSDRALTFICEIDNEGLITVGDAGIVYFWNGGEWAAISPPLGEKLFGASGTSSKDIIVCGENGGLWKLTDREWLRKDIGTNVRLTAVLADYQGKTWVCGIGGGLFAGLGDEWAEVLMASHDLHGLGVFGGSLYVAGGVVGVSRIDGTELVVVKNTVISYGLKANTKFLVSHGDKIGIRFDGSAWAGVRYG